MIYMVPGAVAGVVVHLVFVLLSRILERVSSGRYRLHAHTRLVIVCLVVVAFTFLIIARGDGGNWATHFQAAGFLLAECPFTTITAVNDRRRREERVTSPQNNGTA